MTTLNQKALEAAFTALRSQPNGSAIPSRKALSDAITAYISSLPADEAGELVGRMREAVLAVVAATRAYLPPDGISAEECIGRILAATDNPTINPIIERAKVENRDRKAARAEALAAVKVKVKAEQAEKIMLEVVNEWHRQVGIDDILASKLSKRIADTVATGVFQRALSALTAEPAAPQFERNATNDQIAAVMLQHGTEEQRREALAYAGISAPAAPQKAVAVAWHDWSDMPEAGSKFVALFDDGSGAALYFRHDGGYINADGDETEILNGIEAWTYLPAGFEFWCEGIDEPVTLPRWDGPSHSFTSPPAQAVTEAQEPFLWQCKDYADGWIDYFNEAEALAYQRDTGCALRITYRQSRALKGVKP